MRVHTHTQVVVGSVVVFDEFFCHDTWRCDEYLAWQEACREFGWAFETLAVSVASKQAVMRVVQIRGLPLLEGPPSEGWFPP